tara:strand:+ start:17360 stop:18223 length:864 start_codon:yes stop_codon:yes gene_type:complete
MREELEALAYELKQWRREGVTSVPVSEETLEGLRSTVRRLAAAAPPSAPPSASPTLVVEEEAPAKPQKADMPPPPELEIPDGTKAEQMAWLRDRVLNDKEGLSHLKSGKQLVFGVGSIDAKILFCGEAPGAEEEIQAEPFVGPAGQLLTKIIKAAGMSREEVYISNIMNWRPEMPTDFGNRPPTGDEMAYCLPFLKAQVEIVKPAAIVALGKTAVDGLLGPDPKRRMSHIRGQWFEFAGTPIIPTYHPSYLLRNNSNSTKRQVWEDILLVMERLEMPISEKQRGFFL